VLDEIRQAVQKGYRLVKVYVIYEYQVTRYDRQTREGDLFAQYIDSFLISRQRLADIPTVCAIPKKKSAMFATSIRAKASPYIRMRYFLTQPRRGLAKLCLNSMWGKLTERNNRTKTKLITDPLELYRFFSTPGVEVSNIVFANDTVILASWRFTDEEKFLPLAHTNEVLEPTSLPGSEFIGTVIWTDCKRRHRIVT
jgi:hypothetical protein